MKYIRILAIILLAICFVHCEAQPSSFLLSQSTDQIVTIELMEDIRKAGDTKANHIVICEIPQDLHEPFISDLMSLVCYKSSLDPPTDFGWWIIRITYKNGDIDLIGSDNNAYVTSTKTVYDCYGFHWDEYQSFFSEYVYSIQPEYVPQWID